MAASRPEQKYLTNQSNIYVRLSSLGPQAYFRRSRGPTDRPPLSSNDAAEDDCYLAGPYCGKQAEWQPTAATASGGVGETYARVQFVVAPIALVTVVDVELSFQEVTEGAERSQSIANNLDDR